MWKSQLQIEKQNQSDSDSTQSSDSEVNPYTGKKNETQEEEGGYSPGGDNDGYQVRDLLPKNTENVSKWSKNPKLKPATEPKKYKPGAFFLDDDDEDDEEEQADQDGFIGKSNFMKLRNFPLKID